MGYFRTFGIGSNIEEKIVKAGFIVNSYKEVQTYTANDELEDDNMTAPKDYQYDGSIWQEVLLIGYYERLFCLMRLPELDSRRLWDLYITTKNFDDEVGAISIIFHKYIQELLPILSESIESEKSHIIRSKKKLKQIVELLKYEGYSDMAKQVLDIIATI
jgi:hypothetical protein